MTTELRKMQLEQEKHMPETVYIQQLTKTLDDTGGWSEAWTTIATIKGRLGVLKSRTFEGELGGQVQEAKGFVITLPADTVLQESDRLQVNGKQYVIKQPLSHTEHTALQVECVEA